MICTYTGKYIMENVYLWFFVRGSRMVTRQCVHEITGVPLNLSPKNKHLLTFSAATAGVWDTSIGGAMAGVSETRTTCAAMAGVFRSTPCV